MLKPPKGRSFASNKCPVGHCGAMATGIPSSHAAHRYGHFKATADLGVLNIADFVLENSGSFWVLAYTIFHATIRIWLQVSLELNPSS